MFYNFSANNSSKFNTKPGKTEVVTSSPMVSNLVGSSRPLIKLYRHKYMFSIDRGLKTAFFNRLLKIWFLFIFSSGAVYLYILWQGR